MEANPAKAQAALGMEAMVPDPAVYGA